jgi:dipeptidyl aminopeptidase/acylaminoacyl peptidase
MAKRKINVEDLRRFKFVSDPQISSDGSKIAFVVSIIDYEENKYRRSIWLADTESGGLTQFTHGPGSDKPRREGAPIPGKRQGEG